MSVLSLEHIKKSFDGKVVLKDINLSVEKGEVVSILGPSGSGKSTLLRCATHLEERDSGEVHYAQSEEKRTDFGLVFQNFNLFPHFTVLKNVIDAPIKNQKRPQAEVEKEARLLLNKLGIGDKTDAYPCELSGGQQQRVAIARALLMNPQMLFFDEPTSALDPEITAEILHVLKWLSTEKMTMVIVTHEIDFARAVSDRVVFMDEGMVIEEGCPEEVIDNPKNERTKAFLQKFQM